jgi:hypothetical protein
MPKVIYLEPMTEAEETAKIEEAIARHPDDGRAPADVVPDQKAGPYETYPGKAKELQDIENAIAAATLGMLLIAGIFAIVIILVSVMLFA